MSIPLRLCLLLISVILSLFPSLCYRFGILSTEEPYLLEASRAKYAQQLLRPLGLKNIGTLRVRLAEGEAKLAQMFRSILPRKPFGNFDPNTIGSRE